MHTPVTSLGILVSSQSPGFLGPSTPQLTTSPPSAPSGETLASLGPSTMLGTHWDTDSCSLARAQEGLCEVGLPPASRPNRHEVIAEPVRSRAEQRVPSEGGNWPWPHAASGQRTGWPFGRLLGCWRERLEVEWEAQAGWTHWCQAHLGRSGHFSTAAGAPSGSGRPLSSALQPCVCCKVPPFSLGLLFTGSSFPPLASQGLGGQAGFLLAQ